MSNNPPNQKYSSSSTTSIDKPIPKAQHLGMFFRLFQKSLQKKGFTFLEILCVIAVIAILSSILIPSISTAKRCSLIAKSKAQFHQYIFALEAYYHEYGKYPYFFYDKNSINLIDFSDEFVKALSGHGPYPDYKELTGFELQKLNPKKIAFYHFGEGEFNETGKLKDAFGNPNIYVHIDTQDHGLLKINDKRIAAKIAIYTQKSDGYQDVQSWK